jgi:hypothetical protein
VAGQHRLDVDVHESKHAITTNRKPIGFRFRVAGPIGQILSRSLDGLDMRWVADGAVHVREDLRREMSERVSVGAKRRWPSGRRNRRVRPPVSCDAAPV